MLKGGPQISMRDFPKHTEASIKCLRLQSGRGILSCRGIGRKGRKRGSQSPSKGEEEGSVGRKDDRGEGVTKEPLENCSEDEEEPAEKVVRRSGKTWPVSDNLIQPDTSGNL